MKVRAKKDGFIYGEYQTEGTEFELEDIEHSVDKDDKGKPVIIKIAQQFSNAWMEKVNQSIDLVVEVTPEAIEKAGSVDEQPVVQIISSEVELVEKPKKRGRPAKVKDES